TPQAPGREGDANRHGYSRRLRTRIRRRDHHAQGHRRSPRNLAKHFSAPQCCPAQVESRGSKVESGLTDTTFGSVMLSAAKHLALLLVGGKVQSEILRS